MSEFILLLHSRAAAPEGMSEADTQNIVKRYMDWSQEMGQAGKLTGGQKLTADNGKVLRGADGAVSDGPHGQAAEVIGGYFVVTADDYDGAVEIAKSCPHLQFGGSIEVRQFDSM